MCLAIPVQLKTVSPDGLTALADAGGIEKTVDVSLNRIDPKEAEETLKLLAQTAGSAASDRSPEV